MVSGKRNDCYKKYCERIIPAVSTLLSTARLLSGSLYSLLRSSVIGPCTREYTL